jgi:hypothetical protein
MRVIKFVDRRVSVLLRYCKGSVSLSIRLLVMESDRKATS